MERKLAAILSADVKGYSRLIGEDDTATIRTLSAHRAMMSTLVQQHGGRKKPSGWQRRRPPPRLR